MDAGAEAAALEGPVVNRSPLKNPPSRGRGVDPALRRVAGLPVSIRAMRATAAHVAVDCPPVAGLVARLDETLSEAEAQANVLRDQASRRLTDQQQGELL